MKRNSENQCLKTFDLEREHALRNAETEYPKKKKGQTTTEYMLEYSDKNRFAGITKAKYEFEGKLHKVIA